MPAVG